MVKAATSSTWKRCNVRIDHRVLLIPGTSDQPVHSLTSTFRVLLGMMSQMGNGMGGLGGLGGGMPNMSEMFKMMGMGGGGR